MEIIIGTEIWHDTIATLNLDTVPFCQFFRLCMSDLNRRTINQIYDWIINAIDIDAPSKVMSEEI